MDDKTLQALTVLANKLGTTAEYLWGVLVRQAPISATIDLLVMAVWALLIWAWFRFVLRKTAEDWARDEAAVAFAWGSVCVAVLLYVLIVGLGISQTLSALLNPEYWALKQILK